MANPSTLVVIFGINSRQGSSVAHFLKDKKGVRIRGVTRDAACDASQAWAGTGVQIVQVGEPHKEIDSLVTAIAGASVVFVVTDYFYHYLNDHSTASLASVTKKNVHYHAANREFLDGQAIVNAVENEASRNLNKKAALLQDAMKEPSPDLKNKLLTDAKKISQLKRLILSSMILPIKQDVSSLAMLPPGLQQFRAKALIWEHLHEKCKRVAPQSIRLVPALRMEDWTDFLLLKPNGRFTFGTTLPLDFALPWTHFANDTGLLFHLCLQQRPGVTLNAYSETRSAVQISHIVAKRTGTPCDPVRYGEEALVQMLGPERGQVMVGMLACLSRREDFSDAGVRQSHEAIRDRPDALRYRLTSMAGYVAEGLLEYLEKKGWDSVLEKEGEEWELEQSVVVTLRREVSFEECVKRARRKREERARAGEIGEIGVGGMVPAERAGEMLPPRSSVEMLPPNPTTNTPSPKPPVDRLPSRPTMSPFTPPSETVTGSMLQVIETSGSMDQMIRPPFPSTLTQNLDFFDLDFLRESPLSHPHRANVPDQGSSQQTQPGDNRAAKAVEFIDLLSRSSSVLSTALASDPNNTAVRQTDPDFAARVQLSDTNKAMMSGQGQAQNQNLFLPSSKPGSSAEVIDLRSRSSSVLSSTPVSEQGTLAAGQQHQHQQHQQHQQRQYLAPPVPLPSMITTRPNQPHNYNQHSTPPQLSNKPVSPFGIIDLRSRSSSVLSSAPPSQLPASEPGDGGRERDGAVRAMDGDGDVEMMG